MRISTVAAGLFAAAISTTTTHAASVDLAAFNLKRGALIAQSDEAFVSFDLDNDFLFAEVIDAVSDGFFTAFPSDPSSGFLDVIAPVSFAGSLIAFDVNATATMAAGLFFDGTDYLYGVLTAPANASFDFGDDFEFTDATAELYAIEVIPLPAALPMMLAGLGALAFAARRRA